MTYRFYGKRRTLTPVSRHKRVVAFRHVPYRHVVRYVRSKEEPLTILPISSQQEKKEETKPLTRRQKRQISNQKRIEFEASQPHSTLFQMIVDPLGSLKRSRRSGVVEYTMIGSMLASMLVWLCIGYIPSSHIASSINAHCFSYAVVPFAMQCWMIGMIALVGFAAQMGVLLFVSSVTRISRNRLYWNELVDTHTHAVPFMLVLCAIALYITHISPSLSMFLTTLLIGISIDLDGFVVLLYTGELKSAVTAAYACGVALCIPCMFLVMRTIEEGLWNLTSLLG